MSHAVRCTLRAFVGSIAVAALFGAGVWSPPAGAEVAASAAPDRVLHLMFNDDLSAKSPHFANTGTANLQSSLATRSGGTIRPAAGRVAPRTNSAIRTPAFDARVDGPRAVVKVVDPGGADDLDPGTGGFTFGADFTLNARSEKAGSGDNGNNLIQRGLFGNVSQYKIQIDHERVTCRIKGSSGVVEVTSPVTITAGRWYRAWCSRSGSSVTIAVTRWSESGAAITSSSSSSGATGRLTPASQRVPLSIGGKLTADGAVLDSSDQFNGRIDNAILQFR
jgi:hypothetical protein